MNFSPGLPGRRTCRVHVVPTVLPWPVPAVPEWWQCRARTAPVPPLSLGLALSFPDWPPRWAALVVENIGFEPMTPSLQS